MNFKYVTSFSLDFRFMYHNTLEEFYLAPNYNASGYFKILIQFLSLKFSGF